jgi:penicillin G amidase
MKTLKKILLYVIVPIIIILLTGFIFLRHIANKGLPDYNQDLKIAGLENPVKVYRDAFGIPHIYARSERDLYMVTGYIMAEDRLWQMDLLRRVTLGRLSEIFGDSFTGTDLLLRSLQYGKKSEQLLNNSPKEVITALQAFSDGVNCYLDHNRGNYPIEFSILGYEPEKWKPLYSLNLIGYMAWDLKSGWSELILEKIEAKVDGAHFVELLPDKKNQKSVVYNTGQQKLLAGNKLMELDRLDKLGLDVFSGSNNWAVSGRKSTTGKPLLANDMHLTFNIPGTWMEIHQCVEGGLNVSGLALPGQPLIVVGHNDSIAWGNTNTYVDNLDYYEEKINPADSNQYLFNGRWLNFEVHPEVIKSKSGKIHTCNYRTNQRGPVVSETKGTIGRVLTIRWAGYAVSNEVLSIYRVNRAHNWDEFKNAFKTFNAISQNIVYADVKGNIGMYCCAGVPIRKRDKIFAVLPGWTDEYDWTGMVPFEELPHMYNPSCGYVSSANNRTTDSTYPYHIGTWYSLPYRIERIRELLNEKEKLSAVDFERIQNDQQSGFARIFLGQIMPTLDSVKIWTEPEENALQLLKSWKFGMNINSSSALLLEKWTYNLIAFTFKDEMGEKLFKSFLNVSNLPRQALYNLLYNPNSVWVDNIETERKENFNDIAVGSFKATVKEILLECGADTMKWHWGDFHQLTLSHPLSKKSVLNRVFKLNRGPFAVGGSYHTVSPYSYAFYEPGRVTHGSSHRSIYDLADWDASLAIIPTGTSGIPSSEFYCDQTLLYIKGKYHQELFSSELIRKNAKYSMVFLP